MPTNCVFLCETVVGPCHRFYINSVVQDTLSGDHEIVTQVIQEKSQNSKTSLEGFPSGICCVNSPVRGLHLLNNRAVDIVTIALALTGCMVLSVVSF